jgi:cytochrome b561
MIMPQRIASIIALIAFALCLLQGLAAENTFSTTVLRALLAMAGTYVIGLIVGRMGERMLEDTPKPKPENEENSARRIETSDR